MKVDTTRNLSVAGIDRMASCAFAVVALAPLFFAFDYPMQRNPDIGNYSSNYLNGNWSYELGYELLGYLFREVVDFTFEQYWISILSLQLLLLMAIYCRRHSYVFAIVNIYIMSEFFYGTQVRYAMGSLVFVASVVCTPIKHNAARYFLWIISFFFHYGLGFTIIAYNLRNLTSRWLLSKGVIIFFALIAVALGASSLLNMMINVVLPYTRFGYYAGSHYLEAKSLSSTVYILSYLVLIYTATACDKSLAQNSMVKFSVTVLYLCMVFHGAAVLSGRLLLLNYILEPLLIQLVLLRRKTSLIGIGMLVLSLSKLYYYVSLGDIV